ncbi:hypothetical protein MSG28_001010 [Choristoneura fumiferana]|uniref:Uncharacterized protein n=1 Tax=Choristoneura fumiferana TaxID=7141 RepID=A0ACC0K3N7_CHOFU|nr:hypothetical protein MSG28_001010 [Choristoneura fumiferana]
MAMYYYASKLNEASCSGCNIKVPPPPNEPAPIPPPPSDHAPLPPDPALLHGTGLSYYDNDDYYSMVRGNKFMSENSCKHLVMNGGINFVTTQKDATQGKVEVKDLVDKELLDMKALVRVLMQWTSMFPYDFRDDRVMALVRSITQRLAGNRVNFEKCALLARHVSAQMAARRLCSDQPPAPAPPSPHLPVWRYLNDSPTLNENALELVSFEREPPVDHMEKERLKRLRAAT